MPRPQISDYYKESLKLLDQACKCGDLGITLARRHTDGKEVVLLCIATEVEDKFVTLPLAEMLPSNPTILYDPVDATGSFYDTAPTAWDRLAKGWDNA